ncbi:MAG: ATP-binding protein [Prevotellaceae bacterium]|nr:ATP-binding protein [Prevotellaceae bacterium]
MQKKTKANLLTTKRIPKTFLAHIERIIELAENSGLNDAFYQKAKENIRFVAQKMTLSPNQVVLFAIFMEKSDDSRIYISEISKFLGCRNIKAISMMNEVEELEKRRLVRCRLDDDKQCYRVPHEVINAVKQGVAYEPESRKNLSAEQLFQHIERLFEERENKEISCCVLAAELKFLIEDNITLAFCRQIKGWDDIYKNSNNFLLLLLFCHRFVNLDDDNICFYDIDIENLYETKWMFKRIKSGLQDGSNELIEKKILEYINDNGMVDNERFKITDNVKEQLFSELDIKIKQSESKKGLIQHDSIAAKKLFYNEREQMQITQLTALLQGDHFTAVQKRLEENAMRKGFACLFHGAPGTGKTETVYQIAHATGRDIMMVDISDTKSCWFGESEKKIKAVFERYRAFVKTNNTTPILLFNEADAVIGKRKEIGNSNVAQTENAIQNIILQELENLDGIMIATTNLTQNLDKAFERRFLYKIEFEKPSVEAKKMIWLAMIPALPAHEAEELATAYDFSGGQIENIVRKRMVDGILNGTEPSIEIMHNYCRSELLYKKEDRKIGFIKG